jgi:hypothetical protein
MLGTRKQYFKGVLKAMKTSEINLTTCYREGGCERWAAAISFEQADRLLGDIIEFELASNVSLDQTYPPKLREICRLLPPDESGIAQIPPRDQFVAQYTARHSGEAKVCLPPGWTPKMFASFNFGSWVCMAIQGEEIYLDVGQLMSAIPETRNDLLDIESRLPETASANNQWSKSRFRAYAAQSFIIDDLGLKDDAVLLYSKLKMMAVNSNFTGAWRILQSADYDNFLGWLQNIREFGLPAMRVAMDEKGLPPMLHLSEDELHYWTSDITDDAPYIARSLFDSWNEANVPKQSFPLLDWTVLQVQLDRAADIPHKAHRLRQFDARLRRGGLEPKL